MPSSFGGIPYTIMADSGVREGVDAGGLYAIVIYKIPWAQRLAFLNSVVGYALNIGGIAIRNPPQVYTESSNLFAQPDVQVAGHGKPSVDGLGFLAYQYALVTVRYARPPWSYDTSDPSGQPWTSTALQIGSDTITAPNGLFTWSSGANAGKPVNVPVGVLVPHIELSYTRFWMPFLPVSAIASLVGKVNTATFTIADFSCQPQTLLFQGANSHREGDTQGNVVHRLEYRFSYRFVGWNKELDPSGGGFITIQDGGGNTPYVAADFSILP
jgi:hypothetical protein